MRYLILTALLYIIPLTAHALCREFTQDVLADHEVVPTSGIACQDGNGVWHLQTRDGPEEFEFSQPIHFGSIVIYHNPVFKYTRIVPRYVAPPKTETPKTETQPSPAASPIQKP